MPKGQILAKSGLRKFVAERSTMEMLAYKRPLIVIVAP